MPRRPAPLDPDDGPEARFAIALRKLKDQAGFDAPTIDAIAARSHIPRSTLYAVMGGKRIPSIPVLAALVRAWNGDEVEWLTRRSATQTELEVLRREAVAQALPDGVPPARVGEAVGKNHPIELPPEARESVMKAIYGHFVDRAEMLEKAYRDRPTADLVAQLTSKDPNLEYGERERAVFWKLLRQRAGAPTIRDIAYGAGGVRHTIVSEVLSGRHDPVFTRPVLEALREMIPAEPAE